MPEKTYSCGKTVQYTDKDQGETFRCEECGNIHAYPGKRKRKPETVESAMVHPKMREPFWTRFWNWFGGLFSFRWRSRLEPTPGEFQAPPRKNYRYQRTAGRHRQQEITTQSVPLTPEVIELKEQLIKECWRADEGPEELSLRPAELRPPDWQQCVDKMLRHAERVATKLSIPYFVPEVVYQSDLFGQSAGAFHELEDRRVKITIDPSFQNKPRAALAVLAHELCHYILRSNDIRKEPTLMDEKLTDVSMFVLGFGELFWEGQKSLSGKTLGYLPQDQYRALLLDVGAKWMIRDTFEEIDTREKELMRWAIGFFGSLNRVEYAIRKMQGQRPGWSRLEILEKMQYDRFRGR